MATTLLLVGRDGNGKSSTGNSILGKRVFAPRSSSHSGSGEVLSGSSVVDDKEILVVDGPGIGETNIKDPDEVDLTLKSVKKALDLCSTGFTALLVVFKYGSRFTQQEKDTVFLIKNIFGEGVFKDYGIIVMTHGDNFNLDHEDEPTSFETWCSCQTGDVSNLLIECGNRCVLFDNRAKDEWSLRIQRDLLLTNVAQIRAKIGPYTWSDYTKAENGRKVITVSGKMAALELETNKVLDEITQSLRCVDIYGSPKMAIEKISELKRRIHNLKQKLETEAENTDLMKDLLVPIRVTESAVGTKETLAKLELERRDQIAGQSARENIPLHRDIEWNRRDDSCCQECWSCLKQMCCCCFHCVIYSLQWLWQSCRRCCS